MKRYSIRITNPGYAPKYVKRTPGNRWEMQRENGKPALTRIVYDEWISQTYARAQKVWDEVVDMLGYGFWGDVTIIETGEV